VSSSSKSTATAIKFQYSAVPQLSTQAHTLNITKNNFVCCYPFLNLSGCSYWCYRCLHGYQSRLQWWYGTRARSIHRFLGLFVTICDPGILTSSRLKTLSSTLGYLDEGARFPISTVFTVSVTKGLEGPSAARKRMYADLSKQSRSSLAVQKTWLQNKRSRLPTCVQSTRPSLGCTS